METRGNREQAATKRATEATVQREREWDPGTKRTDQPRSPKGSIQESLQSLHNSRPQRLTDAEINEISDVFSGFIMEKGDRGIASHNLATAMRALGFGLSRDEVKGLISNVNKGSNLISFPEFLQMLSTLYQSQTKRCN